MTSSSEVSSEVDPFDLPEVLGTSTVVWSAEAGLSGHLVRGRLEPAGGDPLPCDLLAVDDAYPAPAASEAVRLLVHQAWRHGQVHLATCEDRLTVMVPGTRFTSDLVLDAVARFAKALGAHPSSYAVLLRLGA